MNNTLLKDITILNHEISKRSPAILIFLGITGMVSTVVMACQATPKANRILEELHDEQEENEEQNSKPVQIAKEIKAVAPVYVPSVILGGLSIVCIIGSYSITNKRMAALATAYSISERTLHEYQNKVIETIGEKKEEKLRSEIAQDKVRNNPPKDNEVIITGRGEMLCFDALSGRYFKSSVEAIRKAESVLNHRLISEMYVSLNDFYSEINISQTRIGDELGWNIDELIEFSFSSVLAKDDTPCLSVDYNVCPQYDFRNLH